MAINKIDSKPIWWLRFINNSSLLKGLFDAQSQTTVIGQADFEKKMETGKHASNKLKNKSTFKA